MNMEHYVCFESTASCVNVVGCGRGEGRVEHCGCCRFFWKFVTTQRPTGLALSMHLRSKEAFLLLHGELSEVDRIRMALGMYALHRLGNRLEP